MNICSNGHTTIVHDGATCPLCNLIRHNNTVHDFIESKGGGLVSELVQYQREKQSKQEQQ